MEWTKDDLVVYVVVIIIMFIVLGLYLHASMDQSMFVGIAGFQILSHCMDYFNGVILHYYTECVTLKSLCVKLKLGVCI